MTLKKKHILMVGPFPEPITGNSLANKVAFENTQKLKNFKVDKINTSLPFFDESVGFFSLKKLLFGFKFNINCYKILFNDIVYITPGQSFLGIFKYSVIVVFSKLLRKRLVFHIHGNQLEKTYHESGYIYRKIIWFLLSRGDKGIVLSKSLKGNLTPFLKEKNIHVVQNFVEDFLTYGIEHVVKEKNFNEIRIVFLSNLMTEKGILDLLEALKLMEAKSIKYKAKLAGYIDNKVKGKIEKYLTELKNTEYLGVIRGNDKKNILLWSNIFVFPTYYKMEGQPISLLEAMATGNFILTTDHAGISDVFSEDNGIFIKKQSPSDIVKKIIFIIENGDSCKKKMITNYNYARKNFSVENYINNLTRVFE